MAFLIVRISRQIFLSWSAVDSNVETMHSFTYFTTIPMQNIFVVGEHIIRLVKDGFKSVIGISFNKLSEK